MQSWCQAGIAILDNMLFKKYTTYTFSNYYSDPIQIVHTFQNPSTLGHLNSPQVWYSDPDSIIKHFILQRRYEIMMMSCFNLPKSEMFKIKYISMLHLNSKN